MLPGIEREERTDIDYFSIVILTEDLSKLYHQFILAARRNTIRDNRFANWIQLTSEPFCILIDDTIASQKQIVSSLRAEGFKCFCNHDEGVVSRVGGLRVETNKLVSALQKLRLTKIG